MSDDLLVDPVALREQVKDKYRDVALSPHGKHHFHTGRPLAARLGYNQTVVDALPDQAVESFAGVGNPFSLRNLVPGEKVVDIGSGAGFDSFIAAGQTTSSGRVVGIDMTPEMLTKSRQTARDLQLSHVEFVDGLAELLGARSNLDRKFHYIAVDTELFHGANPICVERDQRHFFLFLQGIACGQLGDGGALG